MNDFKHTHKYVLLKTLKKSFYVDFLSIDVIQDGVVGWVCWVAGGREEGSRCYCYCCCCCCRHFKHPPTHTPIQNDFENAGLLEMFRSDFNQNE
jgi:hypothetical protein